MSYREPIIQNITHVAQQYSTGYARAIMLGGGLGYSIQNGFYHHVPLVILNPFAYASYQVFVSQPQVIAWSKQTLHKISTFLPE
jgi:hypothetical protein